LRAGQLLFVSRPAAVLQGPVDEMPDPELLADQVHNVVSSNTSLRQVLSWLYRGTGAADEGLPDLRTLTRLDGSGPSGSSSSNSTQSSKGFTEGGANGPDHDTSSSSSSSSSQSHASSLQQQQSPGLCHTSPQLDSAVLPWSAADASACVRWNAFGDAYEDLAAAVVAGRQPCSQVGVWPAFAFLNHSCTPNSVHYVMGDSMVVRAVADIPKGEEVLVSYLGRELLTPLQVRQELLEERYEFICRCPRCLAEGQLDPELQRLMHEMYSSVVQVLRPEWSAYVQKEDPIGVSRVWEQLMGKYEKLKQLIRRDPSENQQLAVTAAAQTGRAAGGAGADAQQGMLALDVVSYIYASVYDLLELMLFSNTIVGRKGSSRS